jgi:hypothetical protein
MPLRLFTAVVVALSLVAAPAMAEVDETTELRKAVAALDATDPAVGYALSVRNEGRLLVGIGAGVAGASLLAASVETAVRSSGRPASPIVAGIGVPMGIGVVVAGLPGLLSSGRYLGWYVEHGPSSTPLARLKLIHRWRVDLLRVRRDTSLFGSAFLGGAAVLSGVVWAARDTQGHNGPLGPGYDPTDGVVTLGMLLAGGGTAAIALVSHLGWEAETGPGHRLFAGAPTSLAPTLAVVPGPRPAVAFGLTGSF